jgi:arylsulfatase A-like enzyme
MRSASILLTALLLAPRAALLAADNPKPQPKPNILLIYTDDHGWADLGVQGVDRDIRTPNFDLLARDGVRFARGYVSAPQCMPSRAGLITGRYQQRFGVEDNNKGPLPLKELTIAERLKPAGYISGFVGKSHLDIGGSKKEGQGFRILPDHLPHHQGFEEYFRGELRQYYASHDLQGRPFADAPRLVRDDRFRVVVQTEVALSFLDRRAAKPAQPWFLYLAWYAPHVPLESPEPWFSKAPAGLPLKRRQALAMIAAMDDGLGRIRAKLREMGVENNTLIFIIGDNGAPLGSAWDGSINLPMVGQKGMLSEGGIRTPFIAAWPGHWPAGVTYDQPVINLDVAATAVALAGLPHDSELDGVNLAPFVTGRNPAAPHERLFWRWGSQSAVLDMPFKLIKLGARPPLLFDVSTPAGENVDRNLAAKHPEIAARLEQRLQAWAAELEPPGLSTDSSAFSRHHEGLFTEHRMIEEGTAKPAASANHSRSEGTPVAPSPPMGWNSWNWHGKRAVNEAVVRETIDAMVATGLRDAGYDYVVVDGGWRDNKLGTDGTLQAHPEKFPGGMKALASYAHARGMKFGLHIVPGTHDCGGDPVGSLGREEVHLAQFVDWGLDFLKIDRCQYRDSRDNGDWNERRLKDVYLKWSGLLAQCPRAMVYSISAYEYRDWYPGVCQMGRTTYDIAAHFSGGAIFDDGRTDNRPGQHLSIMNVVELNNAVASHAGRGYWNDPDMLVTGDPRLTADEQCSHFALWCIMTSPLLLGNDPRNMSASERELLLNREAIAINQDPTEQGRRLFERHGTEVWLKKLREGRMAVLLLNRDAVEPKKITFAGKDGLPAGQWLVRDVFGHSDLGSFSGEISRLVSPHGCALLLLESKKP